MKKSIKKSTIIIVVMIIVLIITIISFLTYKMINNGNNITNKSKEDIVDHILNIKSYNALIEIEVETNKNKNKYIVKQDLKDDNTCKQEVVEPQNIAGLTTEFNGRELIIRDNQTNLSTTFENYSYVVDNNLWINSFINDYKKYDNAKASENNNEILLEVKNEQANKYNIYKKLYIDKNTGKPTKMIVQDINQNTLIYILYTKIEIS